MQRHSEMWFTMNKLRIVVLQRLEILAWFFTTYCFSIYFYASSWLIHWNSNTVCMSTHKLPIRASMRTSTFFLSSLTPSSALQLYPIWAKISLQVELPPLKQHLILVILIAELIFKERLGHMHFDRLFLPPELTQAILEVFAHSSVLLSFCT